MAAILKCKCTHSYQDEKYGKQNRVCNKMIKEPNHRCTVCGAVLSSSENK